MDENGFQEGFTCSCVAGGFHYHIDCLSPTYGEHCIAGVWKTRNWKFQMRSQSLEDTCITRSVETCGDTLFCMVWYHCSLGRVGADVKSGKGTDGVWVIVGGYIVLRQERRNGRYVRFEWDRPKRGTSDGERDVGVTLRAQGGTCWSWTMVTKGNGSHTVLE